MLKNWKKNLAATAVVQPRDPLKQETPNRRMFGDERRPGRMVCPTECEILSDGAEPPLSPPERSPK